MPSDMRMLICANWAVSRPPRSTCAGEIYMDVGTLEGYHQALNFLRDHSLVRDENPQAA